jgi:hypothetical protein
MVCNSCKNEFDNINGLKFCPYCGVPIEENIALAAEQGYEEEGILEKQDINDETTRIKKMQDTLKMPKITEKEIRKYKIKKVLRLIKESFTKMKVIIPIITICLVMVIGVVGYSFFIGRPVDEGKIKEDLIGKTIKLPKGTNIEIKKSYIKNFSINSRNTNKSEKKDDIKVAVTVNNGTLEVNTILSLQYIYEGKNQWKFGGKVELAEDTTVKPVIVMEERQLLDELKKLSINIGEVSKSLAGEDVKTLRIVERMPNLESFSEEVLIEAGIDSGLIAAVGKIKCKLAFENEVWNITGIERNSTEDFALVLSPTFAQEKILEVIKKEILEETVTHQNVFAGKGFFVRDNFTKSISIVDKKFDAQNGKLTVTAKRENTAGEIKTTLANEYTFTLSFTKMDLIKKSKTAVNSVTIDDMTKDFIVSTIANVEVEGGNLFFWYSDNHKITTDEAKTFKTDKILFKKGLQNVKYVYGSITYNNGNKQKTTALVATYYLVYDSSKGYTWKLDKIIGEDSPNYKNYIPEPK